MVALHFPPTKPQKPDLLFLPNCTDEENDTLEGASGFPKVTQLIPKAELSSNLGVLIPALWYSPVPPNAKAGKKMN